jgi:hypothetical protein
MAAGDVHGKLMTDIIMALKIRKCTIKTVVVAVCATAGVLGTTGAQAACFRELSNKIIKVDAGLWFDIYVREVRVVNDCSEQKTLTWKISFYPDPKVKVAGNLSTFENFPLHGPGSYQGFKE